VDDTPGAAVAPAEQPSGRPADPAPPPPSGPEVTPAGGPEVTPRSPQPGNPAPSLAAPGPAAAAPAGAAGSRRDSGDGLPWHSRGWWQAVGGLAAVAAVALGVLVWVYPRGGFGPAGSDAALPSPTAAVTAPQEPTATSARPTATLPPATLPTPTLPTPTLPAPPGDDCDADRRPLAVGGKVTLHRFGNIRFSGRTDITYQEAVTRDCGGTVSFDPHPQLNFSDSAMLPERPADVAACAAAGAGDGTRSQDLGTGSAAGYTGMYLCGPDNHGNVVLLTISDASRVRDPADPRVTLVFLGFLR
jgi:hypothetical protein